MIIIFNIFQLRIYGQKENIKSSLFVLWSLIYLYGFISMGMDLIENQNKHKKKIGMVDFEFKDDEKVILSYLICASLSSQY